MQLQEEDDLALLPPPFIARGNWDDDEIQESHDGDGILHGGGRR